MQNVHAAATQLGVKPELFEAHDTDGVEREIETAKALGLTIPPSLRLRADQLIE